jgi:uncharacterized protein YigE (DUF2233 family)
MGPVHGRYSKRERALMALRRGRKVWRAAALATCVSLAWAPNLASAGEVPRPSFTFEDSWKDLSPGVRYLVRKTTVPTVIHTLVVDMSVPGARVQTTPYDQRWQTVREYGSRNKLLAAINGGFWGMMQRAEGMTAGGGVRWPDGKDDAEVGFFAITREGRGWISPPELEQDAVAPELISEAVSGQPMLVRNGRVDISALDAFESSNLRHPRSAVGVSKDGKKVFLVVSDGRQGHSRGMTLYELARFFAELGADMAINLDGGGSSTMYVASEGGIVNSPSGGRWEARLGLGAVAEPKARRSPRVRTRPDGTQEVFIRGVEREVMNHIGVAAQSADTGPAIAPAPASDAGVLAPRADEPTVVPPREPTVQLGRSREVLYPLAYIVLGVLVPLGIGVAIFMRRRRRRRKP